MTQTPVAAGFLSRIGDSRVIHDAPRPTPSEVVDRRGNLRLTRSHPAAEIDG